MAAKSKGREANGSLMSLKNRRLSTSVWKSPQSHVQESIDASRSIRKGAEEADGQAKLLSGRQKCVVGFASGGLSLSQLAICCADSWRYPCKVSRKLS